MQPDGTYDAETILAAACNATRDCIAGLIARAKPLDITVYITSFVGNLVGIDHEGSPCTPLFTYAFRSNEAKLRSDADLSAVLYDHTGVPFHTAYATAWLRQRALGQGGDDDTNRNAKLRWISISSLLIGRLCGEHTDIGISPSEASWAGLVSLRDGGTPTYDPRALECSNLSADDLPRLLKTSESHCIYPLSATTLAVPGLWGGPCNVSFFAGLGDGAAATIASGVLAAAHSGRTLSPPPPFPSLPRVVAVSVGTSAAMRTLLPHSELMAALCACPPTSMAGSRDAGTELANPLGTGAARHKDSFPACPSCGKHRLRDLGLWCYRVTESHVLLGGALTDGGSLVALLASVPAPGAGPTPSINASVAALAESVTGSDGGVSRLSPSTALCLPFWSGERSTGWRGCARGVWAGLDGTNTTPEHLLHAAMDGVAFRLRAIHDRLCALAPSLAEAPIVLSGGAVDPAHNPLWAPIIATALDRTLLLHPEAAAAAAGGLEATTLGLAAFHEVNLGAAVLHRSLGHTREVTPVSEESAREYQHAYLRHCRLYDAMAGFYDSDQ